MGSGLNNNVYALAVLPNEDVVAGGSFTMAGNVPANYIARWDGTVWSSLGSGTNNYVIALATVPNGDLIVGGDFSMAGDRVSPYLARYGIPSGCMSCDTIDFNHDGLLPDVQDIADFLTVFSGGVCSGQAPTDPPCNTDIDFNNDTLFPDVADITSLLSVFSGGACL